MAISAYSSHTGDYHSLEIIMTDSCFVAKLSHFLELSKKEKSALATLEEDPVTFEKGKAVFSEGNPANTLYTVSEGWFHASNDLADGSRQILQLYYPGDVLGMTSIAFSYASATVVAAQDATLCRFPQNRTRGYISRASPSRRTVLCAGHA